MQTRSKPERERVVRPSEAADRLGISLRAFYTLLALKKLRRCRVTKQRVGVLESDLLAYMREQRR